MITLLDWGAFGDLIDQSANTGCNRIIIRRDLGTVIRLRSLIASMRTQTAAAIYSRLIVVDGEFDAGLFQTIIAGKWSDANMVQTIKRAATVGTGKLLLDTTIANTDPPFIYPNDKPLFARSGSMTIALFAAYVQAAGQAQDATARGFLSADGDEELQNVPAEDSESLQYARLR